MTGVVECVMYGTVMGSLGALLAFCSLDDADYFSHLEMHVRHEHPPLCGREHMAYTSAYFPVKDGNNLNWIYIVGCCHKGILKR
ncbi:hypothetical protein L2E82_51076 [Cichorium intybus]|nr:hypothetical protein L2E82_51076 [Cichorium intybus]